MGEVRQLHWSWLGDLDRKYPPRPQAASPPTPSDGNRPLPPSLWTAREAFTVGRKFKILLQPSNRLTQVFTVQRYGKKHLMFRGEYDSLNRSEGYARRLTWEAVENLLREDRVRWLTSVPVEKWPTPETIGQRATRRSGPAPSSS